MSRQVIQPHKGDSRYVPREKDGQFTENQVSVGKSLAADRRSTAKTVVPKGQGEPEEELTMFATERLYQLLTCFVPRASIFELFA